ncbi:MAG: ATP-binding protein [Alphaproteobacteria bacterium]
MKSSFLGSLNQKFIFAIIAGFLSTSVLFMVAFTHLYATQLERERTLDRSKTEKMLEIYVQNNQLKQEIKKLIDYNAKETLNIKSLFWPLEQFNSLLSPYNVFNPSEDNNRLEPNYEVLNKITVIPEPYDVSFLSINGDAYELRYQAMVMALRFIGAGAFLIILVIITMYWLMNLFVINPIEQLVLASEKIAEGNLDTRVAVFGERKSKDEMKRLGTAFNKMAENLEVSLREIELKEKFQQALIDAIPDGIRVIDSNYHIVSANKAYKKYTEYKEPNDERVFCYQSSHKRNAPCQTAMTTCPLKEIKEKPEAITVVQTFCYGDGKEEYVEVRAAPINFSKDGEGNEKDLLIVESIRDLTKDIRFSHQQKLSSIGLLATSVAHEMRNPLGSVRLVVDGLINRLEKKDLALEENIKYLKMINEQLVTCIDVTERLLKMGRISSGKLEKINCSNAIKETISLLDYEAKKQGIKVNINAPEKPVYIMASESEFRIVMVNLVQNAFNAVSSDGEINVYVNDDNQKVTIKVADNGQGIEKNKLPRIFEPFFSDRKKKDDNKEGTGLGLTITKSIVEGFGGTIKVESKMLEGTTFSLDFPKI